MDNLSIRTNAYKPTFGTAFKPQNFDKLLPSRKALAEYVMQRIRTVDPNDALGRTYEAIADDAGYHILLRNNDRHQGIRVDILTKRLAEDFLEKGWDMFDSMSFVNIYKNKNDVKPNDINKALNRNLKEEKDKKTSRSLLFTVLTVLGTVVAGSLIANKCNNDKQAMESIKQIATELVNDTAKVAKEAANTLPDSTFKNAQKAVKSVR